MYLIWRMSKRNGWKAVKEGIRGNGARKEDIEIIAGANLDRSSKHKLNSNHTRIPHRC